MSVLDGLLCSADERLVFLVALLDFSAAIDTLDHFASCFSDRFHSLIVDRVVSASGPLVY